MKDRTTTRRLAALFFALCLLLCFALQSFAGDGGGGGNGDGTGGGKDKPLVLVSSSIVNGAENISQKPQIVLTFSKNVVHFTVRDNNQKCFSMTDETGKTVPINVLMGDDQVDPSIKRIVTIEPQSALTPGTTYLLKIGGGITSKSGVSIGRDNYISFTVAGEKPTTTKPTTTKPTTTKPATTKPTTTKPTTTMPTTTKPTTTKPTTTKPATTKPTTTKPTTAAPSANAAANATTSTAPATTKAPETTAVPAAATTVQTTAPVPEASAQSESKFAPAAESTSAPAAPDPETVPATQQTSTTALTTAEKKPAPDRQQAWRDTGLYLLFTAISIIVLTAVILVIKKKKH